MLISNINNGKFVEIGCDRGLFSKHILTVNKTATLYSIDPYISYNDYNDAINNVTGDNLYNKVNTELTQEFGGRVKLIREFSNKANNLVPDNLDFIYIDGNHQYSYVYEDLCIWWEKLSPNGIIVGDDAVDIDESQRNTNGNIFIEWCPGSYGEYGVIKAFNQFISEKKCKSKLVGNQYVIFK
jgi:predicted O-methyltransferase YrrM